MTCLYCPEPRYQLTPRSRSLLCAWHLDHEAACNVAEDEGNGYIAAARVDELLVEWGWPPEEVERRRSP